VALCGSISQYNAQAPEMGPRLLGLFVGRRVNMRGFIVSDFAGKTAPVMRQMGEWVRSGRLKYKEDILEGLAQAPRAFIGLLRGEYFGKPQVKVGPDPTGRCPPRRSRFWRGTPNPSRGAVAEGLPRHDVLSAGRRGPVGQLICRHRGARLPPWRPRRRR